MKLTIEDAVYLSKLTRKRIISELGTIQKLLFDGRSEEATVGVFTLRVRLLKSLCSTDISTEPFEIKGNMVKYVPEPDWTGDKKGRGIYRPHNRTTLKPSEAIKCGIMQAVEEGCTTPGTILDFVINMSKNRLLAKPSLYAKGEEKAPCVINSHIKYLRTNKFIVGEHEGKNKHWVYRPSDEDDVSEQTMLEFFAEQRKKRATAAAKTRRENSGRG